MLRTYKKRERQKKKKTFIFKLHICQKKGNI